MKDLPVSQESIRNHFNEFGWRNQGGVSEAEIAGFFREYPWAHRYVGSRGIRQIHVSPHISQGVLDHPMFHWHDPVGVNGSSEEFLYLLDENGEAVYRTYQETYNERKYFFLGPFVEKKQQYEIGGVLFSPEIPMEVFKKMGNEVDRIRYLLSFDTQTSAVILYARPKGVDFWEWVSGED